MLAEFLGGLDETMKSVLASRAEKAKAYGKNIRFHLSHRKCWQTALVLIILKFTAIRMKMSFPLAIGVPSMRWPNNTVLIPPVNAMRWWPANRFGKRRRSGATILVRAAVARSTRSVVWFKAVPPIRPGWFFAYHITIVRCVRKRGC